MAKADRFEQALKVLAGVDTWRPWPGHDHGYLMTNGEGTTYQVCPDGCSCPAGKRVRNGKVCRHLTALRMHLAGFRPNARA